MDGARGAEESEDITMVDTTFMPSTKARDVVPRLDVVAKQFDAIQRELEDCARSSFGVRRHVNVPFVELCAIIEHVRGIGEALAAVSDTIVALRALNAAIPVNSLYALTPNLTPNSPAPSIPDANDWLNDQPQDSLARVADSSGSANPANTIARTRQPSTPLAPGATFPPSGEPGENRGCVVAAMRAYERSGD
jgi:hypothetical protein